MTLTAVAMNPVLWTFGTQVVLASDWDEVGSKQRQMSDLEWGMELDAVPLVQAVRRARSVGAADADMSAAELQVRHAMARASMAGECYLSMGPKKCFRSFFALRQ